MKLQKERELLVFTFIDQNGLHLLDEIRSELEMRDDPGFDFDSSLNEMVKEKYLEQSEDLNFKITAWGNIHFSDLKVEQYEDLNKIPIIILGVVIVVAILAFMKIFPRMFP
jgi:hypothetical protein